MLSRALITCVTCMQREHCAGIHGGRLRSRWSCNSRDGHSGCKAVKCPSCCLCSVETMDALSQWPAVSIDCPELIYCLQVVIGRGEKIPESPAGPVIVCTRNDDLNGVVESTPSGRRKGL